MEHIKKILITGSNGMLGKDIIKFFEKTTGYDIYGVNRSLDLDLPKEQAIICDITDSKSLKIILESIEPDIIIHCAAMVDVDKCETDKEYTYRLNIQSTRELVEYNPDKTKFVYISTDSVFNGREGKYSEESKKDPLNYYAKTKSKAEEIIMEKNKSSIIIRTNIYGFHKVKGRSMVEWALGELLKNREIAGFNDVYFNPVYTKQLAMIVNELIKINYSGIIHVGTNQCLSKYEFLCKLANKFNINEERVGRTSVDNIKFAANRPKNTTLSTKKLQFLLNKNLSIDEGLEWLYEDYVKEGIIDNE